MLGFLTWFMLVDRERAVFVVHSVYCHEKENKKKKQPTKLFTSKITGKAKIFYISHSEMKLQAEIHLN